MTTEDQTQSSQGDGQQDQQATERLNALKADLEKARSEARANQARADRAEARVTRLAANRGRPTPAQRAATPPRLQPQSQAQAQQAGEEEEEDVTGEILQDQQKELTLLREVVRRGLDMEDVKDIEFNTLGELQTQLEIRQQQKEIEDLKSQIAAGRSSTPPEGAAASSTRVDTGGQTVEVDSEQVQELNELRNTAKDLRGQKRHREAAWLALRAAHKDPSKRSLVRPEE